MTQQILSGAKCRDCKACESFGSASLCAFPSNPMTRHVQSPPPALVFLQLYLKAGKVRGKVGKGHLQDGDILQWRLVLGLGQLVGGLVDQSHVLGVHGLHHAQRAEPRPSTDIRHLQCPQALELNIFLGLMKMEQCAIVEHSPVLYAPDASGGSDLF